MTPKQIIIDKDTFLGINLNVLCNFARDHFLIVPEVLIYECLTSNIMKERKLLRRFKTLIDSGGYYCPRSITYLKWEARYTSPYPWLIADLKKTDLIREKNSLRPEYTFDSKELQEISDLHYKAAEGILSDTSKRLTRKMTLERPDIATEIKRMPQDKTARLAKLFELSDMVSVHDIAVTKIPAEFIKNKSHFCLSEKWICWQYFRLIRVLIDEYYYRGETGGTPQNKKIEHDFQDMEYVLLLSRADGLLTRDKEMVRPLAKAAFPEKDVFSDLDKVPPEYRCHWS